MSKVCIFPHYFDLNYIPKYVIFYVKELCNHFDKILIVTNKRTIENQFEIESEKINILKVDNEGYDFGMFYKGYQFIKAQNFETIACINDSNILFGNLDFLFSWASQQKVDFWGLFDSYNQPIFSTHLNNYHIQSHFLVFNKKAILQFESYFEQLDLNALFNIKMLKQARAKVINDWEIGVSQFLISRGLTCKAYYSIENLGDNGISFDINKKNKINISLDFYAQVIKSGIPLLKKKIVTSVKPKHIFAFQNSWENLIKKYCDTNIPPDLLIKELLKLRNRLLLRKIFKY